MATSTPVSRSGCQKNHPTCLYATLGTLLGLFVLIVMAALIVICCKSARHKVKGLFSRSPKKGEEQQLEERLARRLWFNGQPNTGLPYTGQPSSGQPYNGQPTWGPQDRQQYVSQPPLGYRNGVADLPVEGDLGEKQPRFGNIAANLASV